MRTVDFIKQHIPAVLQYYGMPPITGMTHYKGDCPICSKRGKFRIDNKNSDGSWICVCGSGDVWSLLTQSTGKDFKTLAKEIDSTFGNTYKHEAVTPVVNTRLQDAVTGFKSAQKLEGTPGEEYLNTRGIFKMPTGGVKWSPGVYNSETKGDVSCLYSIASNEYSEAIQRHITFLDGDKKANLEAGKKMLTLQEYQGPIAVKLFQVKSTLGIAEGIETALSAHQIYNLPVWSTLNATLMKKFKAPSGVNTLMIFADNDKNGTGLNAAFECANKNLLSNNDVEKVIVRWPVLSDFNDMLQEGCEVFEWALCN